MKELAAFERQAKALLKKAGAYALSGGDTRDSDANRKTELALYRGRDKLDDAMHALGLSDEPAARELVERVKRAISEAPAVALQKRTASRDAEIAKLNDKEHELRAWRIANGLEDPPKTRNFSGM